MDGGARAAFEAEMRAGGVDWRMHLYGGVQHSVTHPHADRAGIPGLAYDPAAADRAWLAMLASAILDRPRGPTLQALGSRRERAELEDRVVGGIRSERLVGRLRCHVEVGLHTLPDQLQGEVLA